MIDFRNIRWMKFCAFPIQFTQRILFAAKWSAEFPNHITEKTQSCQWNTRTIKFNKFIYFALINSKWIMMIITSSNPYGKPAVVFICVDLHNVDHFYICVFLDTIHRTTQRQPWGQMQQKLWQSWVKTTTFVFVIAINRRCSISTTIILTYLWWWWRRLLILFDKSPQRTILFIHNKYAIDIDWHHYLCTLCRCYCTLFC